MEKNFELIAKVKYTHIISAIVFGTFRYSMESRNKTFDGLTEYFREQLITNDVKELPIEGTTYIVKVNKDDTYSIYDTNKIQK
jgi:hypothetical protein